MIKKLIFLLFISVLPFKAYAEKINDIIIDGNTRISDETILIYGKINKNDDFSEIKINQIIQDLYSTEFFSNVSVEIKNSKLIIKLNEYPLVNQLILIGEKTNKLKEQILKLIKTKENRPYVKANLSNDIELIKSLYSSIGFNFTEVQSRIKKIDENNLDLIIEIDKGNKTKISKITFIGNKNVGSKRLTEIIASEEDKFWKVLTRNTNLSENLIKMDIRLLTNYYKSLGYYDIKVNSNFAEIDELGNAKIVYSIEEGKRYIIKKISINLDEVFDNKLFLPLNKSFKKLIGNFYSPFKVKELLEEVDALVEINSLQFVEHNVQEIIEGDEIKIVINIFEGEKFLVEKINILGNNITNEDVIRGELILDEGDPYSALNLDKSIAELRARNIFKTVRYEVSDGASKDLKVIDILVEEKPTGEISAGAGFGTNGGTFAISIKENNWLGAGKSVGFDFEIDQETLSGSLNFSDPNYNFLGNEVFYSVASIKNDKPDSGYENSIISGSIGTGFEQYKNIFTSLSLNASYDDLRTEDTASASLKKQGGTFSELSGSYGFTHDTRDRAFMPTSGSVITFGQSLPIYADKSFISNYLGVNRYKKFNENVVGAAKFNVSTINGLGSDDVRLSKRKTVSSRKLRGFEKNKVGPVDGNDHVGGNYTATLNFDANLPNFLPEDTKTDINLFLDFGNVWGVDYDSSIDDSNKIRSSTGFAANWLSPLGPMTFIFAKNINKASTDKTEFFNFNLGTTF
jgi:outer membrane protein insertion porin family